MEAPETQFRSVQVLRHTFLPSEPLAKRLSAFIDEKPRLTAPRFLLSSTREVAVDATDFQHYKYTQKLLEIQKKFQENTSSIALKEVGHRFTKEGELHLRFKASHPELLATLTEPIDEIEDVVARSNRGGEYYLMASIHRSRLISRESIGRAWAELRESLSNKETNILYSVTPNEVKGSEKIVALPVMADEHILAS